MSLPAARTVALLCALAAACALGLALVSEYWGRLVPCALVLAAHVVSGALYVITFVRTGHAY